MLIYTHPSSALGEIPSVTHAIHCWVHCYPMGLLLLPALVTDPLRRFAAARQRAWRAKMTATAASAIVASCGVAPAVKVR